MMARKKPETTVAPVTDWDAAQEQWEAFAGRRAALLTARTNMQLAISLARASSSDFERVPAVLKRAAQEFQHDAESHPDRLVARIKAIDAEMNDLQDRAAAEGAAWNAAQRRETTRRALELKPTHRAALARLDAAAAELIAALESERAVRSKLGPLMASYVTPPLGQELEANINFDGVAWWRRRVRKHLGDAR